MRFQSCELLDDRDMWIRNSAHMALVHITGQAGFGYNYLDPPRRRAEAIERWRVWYREHGDEIPS